MFWDMSYHDSSVERYVISHTLLHACTSTCICVHMYTHTHTHTQTARYHNNQLNIWLTFVEISKIKAFVELTIAPTIRSGAQSLLAVSTQ